MMMTLEIMFVDVGDDRMRVCILQRQSLCKSRAAARVGEATGYHGDYCTGYNWDQHWCSVATFREIHNMATEILQESSDRPKEE